MYLLNLTKANLLCRRLQAKNSILAVFSKMAFLKNVKLFLEKYPDLEDQYDTAELVDIYNKSQEFKITEDMLRDIIMLL
jgi:hypothetical protein